MTPVAVLRPALGRIAPGAVTRHVAVTLLWAAVLYGSTRIDLTGAALGAAVAVHLLGVILALGAIVLLDWYGLVWMAGLRRLRDCLRVAEAAHPIIWGGLTLLLLSGLFLAPDLSDPLSWVKQVMVLALLHNGVALKPLERRLMALPPNVTKDTMPRAMWNRMFGATLLSQVAWWGAFAIGVIVMVTRHYA